MVHATVNVLGLRQSAWQTIPPAARIEGALVRLAGAGGNGTVDPNFGVTGVEVR